MSFSPHDLFEFDLDRPAQGRKRHIVHTALEWILGAVADPLHLKKTQEITAANGASSINAISSVSMCDSLSRVAAASKTSINAKGNSKTNIHVKMAAKDAICLGNGVYLMRSHIPCLSASVPSKRVNMTCCVLFKFPDINSSRMLSACIFLRIKKAPVGLRILVHRCGFVGPAIVEEPWAGAGL
ncbi:MAG: hypothetical protein WAU53_19545 [Rhodoplanes sp.]